MSSLVSLLSLSITAIVPVFAWVFLGALLYRLSHRLSPVYRRGNALVFYIGIPGILFVTASKIEMGEILYSRYALAGVLATLVSLGLCWFWTHRQGYSKEQVGIITQASYRSNLAIIGLALCASAFGEEGLQLAALPVGLWTLLFNILAVLVLNAAYGGEFAARPVMTSLLRNPLIIGIALGFAAALSGLDLGDRFYAGGAVFIEIVIPLALIFMGGAIDLRPSRQSRQVLLLATSLRLIIAPTIALLISLALGLRGPELGVTFLLLSGPVAAASYIMVAAKGGDARLAANIVVLSTLLAPVTISLGLFSLKALGLV